MDINSNCYFYSTDRKPWFHAREDCFRRHGDLVNLRTENVWAAVVSQMNTISINPDQVWIGLSRKNIRWINGNLSLSFYT